MLGTNFQIKVWEALLRIPPGAVTTYGGLAAAVQAPQAARAVGTAMAQNPVAYLIPCHRVIRVDGGLGEYHWGIPRKHAMLAWEGACIENCTGVEDKKLAPATDAHQNRLGLRARPRGDHEL